MGEVITFEALRPGGVNVPEYDMLISVSEAGGGRRALNCRFSAAVLDTLRWRTGDKFKFSVEFLDDGQVWTFRRFTNDEAHTLSLSGTKASRTASIKRTVDEQMCSKLFPHGGRTHTALLEDGNQMTAVFVMKYASQK